MHHKFNVFELIQAGNSQEITKLGAPALNGSRDIRGIVRNETPLHAAIRLKQAPCLQALLVSAKLSHLHRKADFFKIDGAIPQHQLTPAALAQQMGAYEFVAQIEHRRKQLTTVPIPIHYPVTAFTAPS
jgi:hypothetical protein